MSRLRWFLSVAAAVAGACEAAHNGVRIDGRAVGRGDEDRLIEAVGQRLHEIFFAQALADANVARNETEDEETAEHGQEAHDGKKKGATALAATSASTTAPAAAAPARNGKQSGLVEPRT